MRYTTGRISIFLCDQSADRSFFALSEISKAEARRRQEMSRDLELVRERNRVLGFISKYDELTGLLNLRGFTEQTKKILQQRNKSTGLHYLWRFGPSERDQ